MYHLKNYSRISRQIIGEPPAPVIQPEIPPESVIQEYWKSLEYPQNFTTVEGRQLTVLHGGTHNRNAGPDFLDAAVQIGDTVLSGDVEIHRESSSWTGHGHAEDPRYANVLLHVVCQISGRILPESLQPRFTVILETIPDNFQREAPLEACQTEHLHHDSMQSLWYLGLQRIQEKQTRFAQQLGGGVSSRELWYQKTLRVLGYTPNKEIMERIPHCLPLGLAREIGIHYSLADRFEIVLGLTGYHRFFHIEVPAWKSLQKRFSIRGRRYIDWKPLRSRPVNHPVLRLFLLLDRLSGWWEIYQTLSAKISPREIIENLCSQVPVPEPFQSLFPVDAASLGRSRAVEMLANAWIPLSSIVSGDDLSTYFENFPKIPVYSSLSRFIARTQWSGIITGNRLHPLHLQGLIHLSHQYCRPEKCHQCPLTGVSDEPAH